MSWLSRRAAHIAQEEFDFFLSFLLSGSEKRETPEKWKSYFTSCLPANTESSFTNPSGFLIGLVLLPWLSRSACVACLGRTPWCV